MLDAYVREHYRLAGETGFGDQAAGPLAYRVFVRADRAPAGTHEPSSMPCFVAQ